MKHCDTHRKELIMSESMKMMMTLRSVGCLTAVFEKMNVRSMSGRRKCPGASWTACQPQDVSSCTKDGSFGLGSDRRTEQVDIQVGRCPVPELLPRNPSLESRHVDVVVTSSSAECLEGIKNGNLPAGIASHRAKLEAGSVESTRTRTRKSSRMKNSRLPIIYDP